MVLLCMNSPFVAALTLENRMSMDTTPMHFTMNSTTYSVPRNYLYEMSNWSGGEQPDGVSVRVVYPGLKPYSKETEACMLRKEKCRVYEIWMTATKYSSEQGIGNLLRLAKFPAGQPGPYGFTFFEIGNGINRTNLYKAKTGGVPIIFECITYDINWKNGATCHHFAHTESGAALSYFFDSNDGLADAVYVDEAIARMFNNFTINTIK